jgi:hypothetical protein
VLQLPIEEECVMCGADVTLAQVSGPLCMSALTGMKDRGGVRDWSAD